MRIIPNALQAHLDTGATTLCWCWRVTRRDGLRLGFTDHDRDLTFDGTTFEAASGLTASELRQTVGLDVDNFDVESALTSNTLDEGDLAAGLFDDARIELYRVNWSNPVERVILRTGSIGEVRRSQFGFSAEIRGLAHYLQQEKGRVFQFTCDADLGDSRCGVVLNQAAFQGSGSVTSVSSERRFAVAGLTAYVADWFTRGLILWTGGANANRSMEVKLHIVAGSITVLELWQAMAEPIVPGNTFTITAGCDKRLETCKTKFSNIVNFRGFPHMTGSDFITSYPNRDDVG